jgi:hypothetical protein
MEAFAGASRRLSTYASWTASACAVHCVVTPLAIVVLPLVGVRLFATASLEWSMIALAALLGGAGIGWSYARVHRNARPVALFVAGVCVMVAARLVFDERHPAHILAAIAGALVITLAARINHALAHRHERCG